MPDEKTIKSEMLRCGKRTFFLDVKLAANNKRYLKITESKMVEEGKPRERNNILIFQDDAERFKTIFNQLSEVLTTG